MKNFFIQPFNFITDLFRKKTRIHVLGDSHAQIFEYIYSNKKKFPLRNTKMFFCIVQGATNMGLANPHSKTQAMPIYNEHLKKIKKGDFIICMLGEVDCGFVIWYRAQKQNKDIEEQFFLSLKNYHELLIKAQSVVGNNVIVCATPLPTITDKKEKIVGEVVNKRLEITATQRERTDLTFRYNDQLKDICRQNGFFFVDYQTDILDKKTNLVSDKFLNENLLDHHLSNNMFSGVLYPKLLTILPKK